MSGKDAAMYMLFQVIGALIGSTLLFLLTSNIQHGLVGDTFATTTGANALQNGVSTTGGFLAEMIFTAIFVLVALGATDKKYGCGNMAGLAIGLSLILIHLVCIPITGTSVNPARSIAPAIFEGGAALSQLWIFILAPFLGSFIAAGIWKLVDDCHCKKAEQE
jgi:aquaporin Z